MGKLKSIAVNGHAEQCFEGEAEQMPCCKDVSEELKVEEVITPAFDFDATPELYQLTIVNLVLLDLVELEEVEKYHFKHYSPPVPDKDIQVLNETFLI